MKKCYSSREPSVPKFGQSGEVKAQDPLKLREEGMASRGWSLDFVWGGMKVDDVLLQRCLRPRREKAVSR